VNAVNWSLNRPMNMITVVELSLPGVAYLLSQEEHRELCVSNMGYGEGKA
jgi:hypothetical protein